MEKLGWIFEFSQANLPNTTCYTIFKDTNISAAERGPIADLNKAEAIMKKNYPTFTIERVFSVSFPQQTAKAFSWEL